MRLLRSLFGSSEPRPAPARRFRPALQSLDSREVPAVIGTVGVDSSGTLVIQTDAATDRVTLTDQGGTVSAGSRVDAVINGELRTFVGVKSIFISDAGSTGTGRNEFTYTANNDTPCAASSSSAVSPRPASRRTRERTTSRSTSPGWRRTG